MAMIWLLAHRKMSTKLMDSPYTETTIDGANSLVYQPGVEPIRYAGQEEPYGPEGTYGRGLHRVSGFVFSFDGDAAEKLLGIEDAINLIVYYLSGENQHRKRTLIDVVFVGDATVRVAPASSGLGDLIGVPFKINIPAEETLADHVIDETD
jgi:hypothetical protein